MRVSNGQVDPGTELFNLPAGDWAKWLPASLIAPWKVSELKAGGELWFNWSRARCRAPWRAEINAASQFANDQDIQARDDFRLEA